MNIASRKRIEWEAILEAYGPDAKASLKSLLADAEISDSDPAAVVISAMFISQIDSVQAFQSIAETIDTGKAELSSQFQTQIEQLRGIIAFAKEHLVETSEESIEKNQKEMIEAVKGGIAKVLGKESQSRQQKATFANGMTIVCAAIVSIASMVVGASIVYVSTKGSKLPQPVAASALEALPNGDVWSDIAESNQVQLATCLENIAALDRRCAITIPQ